MFVAAAKKNGEDGDGGENGDYGGGSRLGIREIPGQKSQSL
jgi:hypothetical protein